MAPQSCDTGEEEAYLIGIVPDYIAVKTVLCLLCVGGAEGSRHQAQKFWEPTTTPRRRKTGGLATTVDWQRGVHPKATPPKDSVGKFQYCAVVILVAISNCHFREVSGVFAKLRHYSRGAAWLSHGGCSTLMRATPPCKCPGRYFRTVECYSSTEVGTRGQRPHPS